MTTKVTQSVIAEELLDLLDPPGTAKVHFGTAAPTGYAFLFGQAISRTTYPKLFSAYGTTHGVGDGSTTFNLPDVRGRAVFGDDNMGGTAANRITSGVSGINGTVVGATGGSEALHGHAHTQQGTFTSGTESANHTHTDSGHAHNVVTPGGGGSLRLVNDSSGTGGIAGGLIDTGYANLGTQSANHTHNTTISGNTTTVGSGSSQNMPPAIIGGWIVRLC